MAGFTAAFVLYVLYDYGLDIQYDYFWAGIYAAGLYCGSKRDISHAVYHNSTK